MGVVPGGLRRALSPSYPVGLRDRQGISLFDVAKCSLRSANTMQSSSVRAATSETLVTHLLESMSMGNGVGNRKWVDR